MKFSAHLSPKKFGDAEYGDHFRRTISKDIAKMGVELNCLASDLKIGSILPGTDTRHLIPEEGSSPC